ncbi:MAG: Ca2+-binding RTX toxin-like protein, partial [Alphaproteobacteria bacterium]
MPPPYTLLDGTPSSERLDARGLAGGYDIPGYGGNDTIYGSDQGDLIAGGIGNDYQDGGLGDDVFSIEGTDQGTDIVRGGDGFDVILGGAGDDVFDLRILSSVERIDGGGGNNVLLGSFTNYWNLSSVELIGITYIDLSVGNDLVTLSAGDDRFRGGVGNDVVSGGGGVDTAFYIGNFADYAVTSLSGGRLQVVDGVNGEGTDTLTDVEILEFADGNYEGGVFTPSGDPNNTAPVASDDVYGATEDTPLVVDALSGVLSNDTDTDLDGLTVDSFDAA